MTELQKLVKQVAELQATIERMKEPKPVRQWQPHGGDWWIDSSGIINKDISTYRIRLNGNEYQTKQQAEWAYKQMRRFNRLLCYVAEFDVDENGVQWMPDWEAPKYSNYIIAYNNDSNKWFYDGWSMSREITVHMSKQCAIDLVDKLNSGSVVL